MDDGRRGGCFCSAKGKRGGKKEQCRQKQQHTYTNTFFISIIIRVTTTTKTTKKTKEIKTKKKHQ